MSNRNALFSPPRSDALTTQQLAFVAEKRRLRASDQAIAAMLGVSVELIRRTRDPQPEPQA